MSGSNTSWFQGDIQFWLIGAIGVIVFLLLTFGLARFARRRSEIANPPSGGTAPHALRGVPGDVDAISERLTSGQVPDNEQLAAADVKDSVVSDSDLPADLAARKTLSQPEDPTVASHTTAEIQRQAPKPLFAALSETRSSFFGRIKSLFGAKAALEAHELEDLEEILYTSDLGPQTVQRLLGAVESRLKLNGGQGFDAVRDALKHEMLDIFSVLDPRFDSNGDGALDQRPKVHAGSEDYLEGLERLAIWHHAPAVIMVVGVNGAGKTTTIGKLARRLAQSGRKVLVAAGDTFRAAAEGQLKVWTERAQVEIFSPANVTDPSAVAFMAVEHAKAEAFDVVIVDTAGRLHTQKNLMEELKKMKRVIAKPIPSAPHEVLLVLDANSGQNALMQAREFHQALQVTGVVLTKLDGTAKGGVAVGLACELQIPIKLIGVGEGIDDLRRFSSREFVDSII
jgi:fused signal recognition particle receptor